MNEDQFSAMLAIIVPPIIEQITKNSNVNDEKSNLSILSVQALSRSFGRTVEAVALRSYDAVHYVSRRTFDRLL